MAQSRWRVRFFSLSSDGREKDDTTLHTGPVKFTMQPGFSRDVPHKRVICVSFFYLRMSPCEIPRPPYCRVRSRIACCPVEERGE